MVRGKVSPRINKAQIKRIFYHSKWPSRKFHWGDVHCKHTGRMEARKYLRKSCCHRIECPAANFLTAFMRRRSLNSATLTIITHRRPERVSDGTNTQVVAQMTNKYRIKIIQKELYNVRDLSWIEDWKIIKESTVAI